MHFIYSENHIKEIVKSYESNSTISDIAKIYNVWPNIILNILNKQGINIRKKGRKKGDTAWNKDKKFVDKTKEYIINSVESGSYKKLNETSIRSTIRKYLIAKNGHKCMSCNLTMWKDVQIPLVCDHIDGNSKNIELSNFRIICNNCDSILPTFKGKNRGKGRKSLRKDG